MGEGGTGGLGGVVTTWLSQTSAIVAVMDHGLSQDTSQVQSRFVADGTSETAMDRVLMDIDHVLGRLDVVINLVGGFMSGRLTKPDVRMWQKC